MRPRFIVRAVVLLSILATAIHTYADDSFVDKAASTLEKLQAKYDEKLDVALEDYEAARLKISDEYVEDLKKVEAAAKRKGDLDGVLATRTERERFKMEHAIPEYSIYGTSSDLAKLQLHYQDRMMKIQKSWSESVVDLVNTYTQRLDVLERALVSHDEIDMALNVRDEKNRVSSSMIYHGALETLTIDEEATESEFIEVEEDLFAADVAAQQSLAEEDGEDDDENSYFGAHVFNAGEEPEARTRKLKGHYTGQKSRSLQRKVLVDMGVYEIDDTETYKSHSRWSQSRSLQGNSTFIPRISIRGALPEALEGCVLELRYFSKDLKHGSIEEEMSEDVSLPAIEQREIIVDGEGLDLYREEYKYSSIHSASQSKTGSEFFGIIATIRDDAGEMIFQQCHPRSLAEFAAEE